MNKIIIIIINTIEIVAKICYDRENKRKGERS